MILPCFSQIRCKILELLLAFSIMIFLTIKQTLRRRRLGSAGLELEGVGVVLEHLPPEQGALAGIHRDVIGFREAQVGDVGAGEYAGDGSRLHDHVGAVGLGEGLVVVVEVRAERSGEGGERQSGGDLGVDGIGQAAGALEAGPPRLPPVAVAGAGRKVHGRRAGGRNPRSISNGRGFPASKDLEGASLTRTERGFCAVA